MSKSPAPKTSAWKAAAAAYYDAAGALRDMVQNHLLQLLSLVAMEPPTDLTADGVRDEKVKVIRSLRPWDTPEKVAANVVRAQYTAGHIDGVPVPGYREEDRINPASVTEAYVAVRLLVDTWRWSGVPFYIRMGKRLPEEIHRDFHPFQGRAHACCSMPPAAVSPAATCSSSASSPTKASRCAWCPKSPATTCASNR